MGVLQGSILSVTLFNIKINSIVKCLNLGVETSLYVDIFLICCKSKHIRTIEHQLQQCLNKINNWTIKNGFKFSKNKTLCIHFCNLHKMHNNPVLELDSSEIPIVEEHKFLGIIFDKKLTSRPHIKYLRSKCNKTIQLLRVIAHADLGADKKSLLKFYQTLIWHIHLWISQKILFKTIKSYTPSRTETGTRSLQNLSYRKLVHRGEWTSTIKLVSCPSNPAHNVLYCPQNKTFFETKTNPIKPFSLWIENLLTKIQIDKTQILKSTTSKTPSWLLKQPEILLNLIKYHKENTHPTIFHEEFLHLKNNHPNHIHIYTDGSKNGNKVSCAAIQHHTKITKQLPNRTSIYSAKVKAIDLAFNFITQTESTKFIIFFNSLWVLTSLNNQNLDNLTMQILNRLEFLSKTKEIELCWIPSHFGIKGNDWADSAAKTAHRQKL